MDKFSIQILKSRVDSLTYDDLNKYILNTIKAGKKAFIGNLNVQGVNIANDIPWFKDFLNNSPIVFCDGVGLQLGAKILKKPVPKLITYHIWFSTLLPLFNEKNISLFLLGANNNVVMKTTQMIRNKYSKITIDYHHGFFNVDSNENQIILDKINRFNPDVLLIGMGMPRQELWIKNNYNKVNANIILNGGGSIELLSGYQKMAARWITENGFGWLFRLFIEPRKRLFKRYLLGNPLFLFRVIQQRIRKK